MAYREEKQDGEGNSGGSFWKSALIFLIFLALSLSYYWSINYALMVHAQNLPFPYRAD